MTGDFNTPVVVDNSGLPPLIITTPPGVKSPYRFDKVHNIRWVQYTLFYPYVCLSQIEITMYKGLYRNQPICNHKFAVRSLYVKKVCEGGGPHVHVYLFMNALLYIPNQISSFWQPPEKLFV